MSYSDSTLVTGRALGLAGATPQQIADGIDWADSIIDARIGGRYTVPFSPVPTIVKNVSADLAAYFIMDNMHTAGAEDVPVLAAQELKNRAYEILKDIQNGTIVLTLPASTSASSLPPMSVMSNNSEGGMLRNFDLVNVPINTFDPPFSRSRGSMWAR